MTWQEEFDAIRTATINSGCGIPVELDPPTDGIYQPHKTELGRFWWIETIRGVPTVCVLHDRWETRFTTHGMVAQFLIEQPDTSVYLTAGELTIQQPRVGHLKMEPGDA